jgi:uncharacterized membrane protein (UPF0127 family)
MILNLIIKSWFDLSGPVYTGPSPLARGEGNKQQINTCLLMCYNTHMRKNILTILLILFTGVGCNSKTVVSKRPSATYITPIIVGSQKIFVQIVSSSAEMEQGLSGREKLSDTEGMLFDFHSTHITRPIFWMKDMKFNLDLIWIYKNQIISITKNVPILLDTDIQNPPTYSPPSDIDMVLEVDAGWSDAHNIKTGDEVK